MTTLMPARWNINIIQGDSYEMRLRLRTEDGTYIDLTGATVHSQIRYRPNGTVLADFTTTLMDQGSANGKGGVILTLTPAQTIALESSGVYDVQIDWPGGSIQTILSGGALLQQDVTRVA